MQNETQGRLPPTAIPAIAPGGSPLLELPPVEEVADREEVLPVLPPVPAPVAAAPPPVAAAPPVAVAPVFVAGAGGAQGAMPEKVTTTDTVPKQPDTSTA